MPVRKHTGQVPTHVVLLALDTGVRARILSTGIELEFVFPMALTQLSVLGTLGLHTRPAASVKSRCCRPRATLSTAFLLWFTLSVGLWWRWNFIRNFLPVQCSNLFRIRQELAITIFKRWHAISIFLLFFLFNSALVSLGYCLLFRLPPARWRPQRKRWNSLGLSRVLFGINPRQLQAEIRLGLGRRWFCCLHCRRVLVWTLQLRGCLWDSLS